MIYDKKVTAIILMAGKSSRYEKGINKNLDKLMGKPVVLYSINQFDENELVDDIILTVRKEEREAVQKMLQKVSLQKPLQIVLGGNTRKASVYNSLRDAEGDIVIIHDGARPFITQKMIHDCLSLMSKYSGVAVGVKAKDTIKVTNEEGVVVYSTNRSNTWQIQTPQRFDKDVLWHLHQEYLEENTTDDCMLLEKNHSRVKIIEGSYYNIKITTPEDMEVARCYQKIFHNRKN